MFSIGAWMVLCLLVISVFVTCVYLCRVLSCFWQYYTHFHKITLNTKPTRRSAHIQGKLKCWPKLWHCSLKERDILDFIFLWLNRLDYIFIFIEFVCTYSIKVTQQRFDIDILYTRTLTGIYKWPNPSLDLILVFLYISFMVLIGIVLSIYELLWTAFLLTYFLQWFTISLYIK